MTSIHSNVLTRILEGIGANYLEVGWGRVKHSTHKCAHLGGSGGMLPQENFWDFKFSEIDSDVIGGIKIPYLCSDKLLAIYHHFVG